MKRPQVNVCVEVLKSRVALPEESWIDIIPDTPLPEPAPALRTILPPTPLVPPPEPPCKVNTPPALALAPLPPAPATTVKFLPAALVDVWVTLRVWSAF